MITVDALFVRWSWARAVLHNGWWLVTSFYLVSNGGLTASQLVLIGIAQGVATLVCEVPAGVIADTFSRKRSIVIAHVLMGTAMIATGLVTDFRLLLLTQILWGISWTFSSGADVAWVTDELNKPQRIAHVLTRSARAQLWGAAVGMAAIGGLAWLTSLATAMITAGVCMLVLGAVVAVQFKETRFIPIDTARWLSSWAIFKEGLRLVRKSQTIWLVFVATFLVNGAADAFVRLFPKQLADIGFPPEIAPIVWLTGLGIVALLIGIPALRMIESRVHGVGMAQQDYALATLVGTGGLLLLTLAPNIAVASVGILLVSGITLPLTRTLASIMVNRQTSNTVRATVHSFLAQAEYLGEIICGAGIALLAHFADLPTALTGCAAFLGAAALIMLRGLSKETVITDHAAKRNLP